ncbi:PilZ domain-containing protein [Sphingobium sp.]|uniref:PilZ domain-containing protein n=1 Tax=Sphingobium sp. TaxID=1912891 RepID=UPI0028BD72A8|nr:PilZ domain-containing protein [Sphingobium sp.]
MDRNQENTGRGPARSGPRDSLFLLTNLSSADGTPLGRARVRNLSATGLMADCERAVPAGIRVSFDLRGIGRVNGSVVWSRDDRIGIAFEQEIDPQQARRPVSGQGGQASVPDYLRQRRLTR